MLWATLLLTPALAAAPCAIDGAKPIAKAAPQLLQLPGMSTLLKGASVKRGASTTVVDERVEPLTLVLKSAALQTALPLALPHKTRGEVALTAQLDGACVEARAVWADEELVRLELALPMEATTHIKRKGREEQGRSWKVESLTAFSGHLDLTSTTGEVQVLYLGKRLPDAEVLLRESRSGGGARHYVAALAALDAALPDDLRADPSAEARGVMFVAQAEQLRASLAATPPKARIAIGADIRPAALSPPLRPLANYWKSALAVRAAPAEARARLLVDDDVEAVFVDGNVVFDRAAGTSTSVEVNVPKVAVRIWIASRGGASAQVFDTNAVMLPGQIYSAGAQRFATVSGGARRECIRVRGKLPGPNGGSPLRWRELGTPPGPLLSSDESFRPSGPQDRREVGVTEMDMTAAAVPARPLVYSYTHPGTYEWVVSPEGGVSLRLLADVKLCGAEGGDSVAP